jgi:hypothetical protein
MCIICRGESLEGLQVLECSGCKHITSIPKIDSLRELRCNDCLRLTCIPQIEGLQMLSCSGCERLTSIPLIENLQKLYYVCCPKLEHNELTIEILNTICKLKRDMARTKICNYIYKQYYAKMLSLVLPRYPTRTIIKYL